LKREPYEKINVKDLKPGMYVILPLSWHEHPFLKNNFLIESKGEIEKIKGLGLSEIQYDPSRSKVVESKTPPTGSNPSTPTESELRQKKVLGEVQQKKVTNDLVATIRDQNLPPSKKAIQVHAHSISMMKNLLENPTAENIKESKKGISAIVSLILNDNDTLNYLTNITSHDYYTYTHSVEVGILSVALAKSLFRGTTNHDLHALGAGFFLHDLGKIGINKDIINKPGRLTDEEMADMRRHPVLGYKLLYEANELTAESKTIVLQHHERDDGLGYPKGLRGNEIHIYGRICAIADVYDALTTDRPYRQKMKPFDALKLMHDQMLNHFQKDLFERFVLLFTAR
jgi:HD-GYP domain-containing protein (c-di-GMP phosphodiesterase class II)